jgi:hypothetical protein
MLVCKAPLKRTYIPGNSWGNAFVAVTVFTYVYDLVGGEDELSSSKVPFLQCPNEVAMYQSTLGQSRCWKLTIHG